MILGIGTDIVEVERIGKAIKNTRFSNRVYTGEEQQYFKVRRNNPQVAAGFFSAKEAVAKALATGFRGFTWKDIEIRQDDLGKPYVRLYGGALDRMKAMGGGRIHISIAHTASYAAAQAVLEE